MEFLDLLHHQFLYSLLGKQATLIDDLTVCICYHTFMKLRYVYVEGYLDSRQSALYLLPVI